MALNTFRLVAIVVLGLIAWFAFFSEKINENRRRAPAGGMPWILTVSTCGFMVRFRCC